MKTYELTYIISPEITAEEAEAKLKELEVSIQEKGGVILKSAKPVAKTLSYQIKKFGSGFFAIVEFQTEPETVLELKEKLDKDHKVLRTIILAKYPARKQKERRQRIKPVVEVVLESAPEPKITAKEEVKESAIEVSEPEVKIGVEKKPAAKRAKAEKNKEKAEMEDIDKKLDEILSE